MTQKAEREREREVKGKITVHQKLKSCFLLWMTINSVKLYHAVERKNIKKM